MKKERRLGRLRNCTLGVIAVLIITGGCGRRTAEEQRIFLSANGSYEKGEYQTALDAYLGLERGGVRDGNLYYNVGNCYYKLGRLGRAILYYERSLRLSPRDEDAKFNLALARSRTVDVVTPPAGLEKLGESLGGGGLLSLREAWWLAACCYFLLAVVLAVRLLWPGRRLLFQILAVLLTATVLSMGLVAYMAGRNAWYKRGVIVDGEITARSEPRADGGVEFKLHEGTVVRLVRSYQGWRAIALGQDIKGWVEEAAVEEI